MNIIDIRPGHNEAPEGIRFSNSDWQGAVLGGEVGGDLKIFSQDNIDCDDEPAAVVSAKDIPAFFAAIRKGVDLGWFPPFEPAPAKVAATPKIVAPSTARKAAVVEK